MESVYKINVTRTVSISKIFEVLAEDVMDAIDIAEGTAYDTDFGSGKEATYESECWECPEDRNECPDCGGELKVQVLEGCGKSLEDVKVCQECGAVFS